jgi:N-acetyltransferase 10
MLKSLLRSQQDKSWVKDFSWDFRRRFIELVGYDFRSMAPVLALSLLEGSDSTKPSDLGKHTFLFKKNIANLLLNQNVVTLSSHSELVRHFTPFDLKRLESYSQNLLDYHVIIDLIPRLSLLYFSGQLAPSLLSSDIQDDKLKPVHLSPVQASILLGVGLQRKSLEDVSNDLNLPVSQIMALFGKVVKKCSQYLDGLETRELENSLETSTKAANKEHMQKGKDLHDEDAWDPLQQNLADDLHETGMEAMDLLKEKQRSLISSLNLSQYAITAPSEAFEEESLKGGIVQIKNSKSSKKRKFEEAKGVAAGLAAGVRGDKTGIYDPQAARGKTIKGKKGDRR